MNNARALLDKHVGSAESVGLASASAPSPSSQAASASASTSQADSASNVGGAALARLASTTLSAFKPHLALPPPRDATTIRDAALGLASLKGDGARTRDPTAVERMMREAGVAEGDLKRVTWRRRITGKRGIVGKPAVATKTTAAARRAHRRSGKITWARPAAAGDGATAATKGARARPLGCSKCRHLPNGCAQCRNPFSRPRKAMK